MSVADAAIEKLRELPLRKQEQALRYIEALSREAVSSSENGHSNDWIDVALSLNLDGPSDWSRNSENYLNGDASDA